ncbi:MAG: flavin reductase family protein [Hyphomonadaceae bacterium]
MADAMEEGLAFRRTMSRLATGVAVITVEAAQGVWAITINSLASVSLRPPLILWLLDNGSDRYAAFAGAPRFGVSVLGAEQMDLAARFATTGLAPVDDVEFERIAPGGIPLVRKALARFDCSVFERRHVGDHLLIVGEVARHDARDGDGLLYFRSRYGVAPQEQP